MGVSCLSEQFFSIGYALRHPVPPASSSYHPFSSSFFFLFCILFYFLLKNLTRDPTTATRVSISVPSKRVSLHVSSREWLECNNSWKSRDVLGQWGPPSPSSSTVRPKSPPANDFRHPLWAHAVLRPPFFSCDFSVCPLFLLQNPPFSFLLKNVVKWNLNFFKTRRFFPHPLRALLFFIILWDDYVMNMIWFINTYM